MTTWEIHITGRVQGVGFRPTVYQLATSLHLRGEVRNGSDGVRIRLSAPKSQVQEFVRQLEKRAPRLARINGWSVVADSPATFTGFKIVASSVQESTEVLLAPDFALCQDCKSELKDRRDRRFHYPFTTCTNCGPRFGITAKVPYDRAATTMAAFAMCPACQKEYHDPTDRRHYSQTNSCGTCGIHLTRISAQGARPLDASMGTITATWRAGKTVALKAMGGFLLTTDATQPAAITALRQKKHRPDKPLAVLYGSLTEISREFYVSGAAAAELTGPTGPIVLLRPRPQCRLLPTLKLLAPGIGRLGVMLPSTPLLQLLASEYGRPLVATSGNRSGSPITFEDHAAWEALGDIADLIVGDNRPLLLPQDDSVISFTEGERRIIHRRGRGIAPNYFAPEGILPPLDLLATGAEMKSAFALLHRGSIYLSQYLGDLSSFITQQHYQRTHRHLTGLLKATPAAVLTDLHPQYAATQFGQQFATEQDIPVRAIQHHEAHFAAVLGEHQLVHDDEPVLGVIWDGTGLGTDGNLWGSVFMRYENYTFTPVYHLPAVPVIAGDKLAQQPRLAALAIAGEHPEALPLLREKFSTIEWNLYQQLRSKASLLTSSMGRLFDAVAALLSIVDHQSYEGMAATRLEHLARSVFTGMESMLPWEDDLVNALLTDLRTCGRAQTALRFHLRLVGLVAEQAKIQKINQLAFSGGVFQNGLLVDLLTNLLGTTHTLRFHEQLSPNDENIAFGQLVHYAISKESQSQEVAQTTEICV